VGAFLIWRRSRRSEGRLTLTLPAWLGRRGAAGTPGLGRRQQAKLVVRLPYLPVPRPRLLDIYVATRYLRTGSLAFVGLLGLFYISSFIDMSEKVFKGRATTAMLLKYFWFSTPQYIYFIVPMATLIAALVTIGALTKTSELTVMRACGVSLYRVAVPLVLLAVVWSGLLFMLDERLMGRANRRATQLEDTIRGRPPRLVDVSNRHWLAGENRLYYYAGFDARKKTLADLSVFEWSTTPFRLTQHVYSQAASYRSDAEWMPSKGWVQKFPKNGGPPKREEWPASRALTLEPVASFGTEELDIDLMTFNDLRDEVSVLQAGGFSSSLYAVAMYTKLAFPLVTIVMTLIAVPFAVTTGRRGTLYGIGLAIALSVLYRLAIVAFAALGAAELLPPALAAWAPDLLFAAGAGYLLLTVRT
jgi:LPS export ABC transporter permease LptG